MQIVVVSEHWGVSEYFRELEFQVSAVRVDLGTWSMPTVEIADYRNPSYEMTAATWTASEKGLKGATPRKNPLCLVPMY